MTAITALIAEDEAPQRAALLDMLAEAWPALDVIGANTGPQSPSWTSACRA